MHYKTLRLMAGLAFAISTAASSADYPSKPVTLVSPYAPGGSADIAARNLATVAPKYLGEEVVVVNRAGAAGVTGSTSVAKARPDGYTLLLARVGSQAAVPALKHNRLPYKWDEFTFISMLEKNPFALVVNKSSDYQNFGQLKKAIQAGKRLTYASTGVGTLLHIGTLMLMDELGVDKNALTHIPYKGGGNAVAALSGGHVDFMFQAVSGVTSGIQSGNLRALFVTASDRLPELPDVPTTREIGYPELEAVIGWSGLYGPPGLPQEVLATWQKVLAEVESDDRWRKLVLGQSSVPYVRGPEKTKAFVKGQYETFASLVERMDL